MFEKKIEQYVELIIKRGLNIEAGDYLHIMADVKSAKFAQQISKAAYAQGAKSVEVVYSDEVVEKLKGLHADDSLFDIYPESERVRFNTWAEQKSKRLSIVSPNPDGMAGVDSNKIMRYQKAASEPMKIYRDALMGNLMSWSIAAVPNNEWAVKVFPEAKTAEEAIEKLWDAIFDCVHLNDGPDACVNWDKHVTTLHEKVETLISYNIKTLHYQNGIGTDLHVNLPEGHVWEGGGSANAETGKWFAPNLPTEEVFTLADANNVNGKVYSSKPLLFAGQLIEDFYFEFKDGAVIHAHAEKGNDLLQEMLAADEGAKRLGEVALVPYASPISLSGNLFFMTLFDENASCHFALGNAYAGTLPKSIGKSKEEQKAMGFNTSIIHVDFMIGTKDLNITATTLSGEKVEIFKDGNFAF